MTRATTWPGCSWATRGQGVRARRGVDVQAGGGETAVRVTEQAIQIRGGTGCTREYLVERWHRDAKIFTIIEGTSEIQRMLIGRTVTGLDVR